MGRSRLRRGSTNRYRFRPLAFAFLTALTVGFAPLFVATAGASPAASGDLLWSVRWNGPANSNDDAYAVAASPDGTRAYVTGLSFRPSSDFDYVTFAYDAADGFQVWAARYNGPGNAFDKADSIAVSPDGTKVFVSGDSGQTGSNDWATVAYEAETGAQLWVATYDGPNHGDDYDPHLAVSPDGSKVFVAGRSEGVSIDEDYATVAYDAATGSTLWSRRYNGPGKNYDFAYAIAATADAVFVTGQSVGAGGSPDYATVAYDGATGSALWLTRYNGPANATDSARSIAASPDGSRVFVTGYSGGAGTGYDYQTFAYDAARGTVLWGQRYNGRRNDSDKAVAVGVSPDGTRVFVTGSSYQDGQGDDFVTLAFDADTGAGLWRRRTDGPTHRSDDPVGLATTVGGVFVSGSTSGNGFDFLTVAYDPTTGKTQWGARYNGPTGGHDIPFGIATSGDGLKVFVTGYSYRALANEDHATVAYAT